MILLGTIRREGLSRLAMLFFPLVGVVALLCLVVGCVRTRTLDKLPEGMAKGYVEFHETLVWSKACPKPLNYVDGCAWLEARIFELKEGKRVGKPLGRLGFHYTSKLRIAAEPGIHTYEVKPFGPIVVGNTNPESGILESTPRNMLGPLVVAVDVQQDMVSPVEINIAYDKQHPDITLWTLHPQEAISLQELEKARKDGKNKETSAVPL